MNVYMCVVCGFIYNEAEGRPEDGIPPGTLWADVPDGWWIEGCLEGITGWAVGPLSDDNGIETSEHDHRDAEDLYGKLEHVILPMYYQHPAHWANVMRGTIAINASFFNTNRMIQEYVLRAYFH